LHYTFRPSYHPEIVSVHRVFRLIEFRKFLVHSFSQAPFQRLCTYRFSEALAKDTTFLIVAEALQKDVTFEDLAYELFKIWLLHGQ